MSDNPLLLQRATINPYLAAANLIFHRLRWDLDPQSFKSRSRLRALRNAHEGEKAVILCNGPSLNKVDFDSLEGTFCFGLNKINLLFERGAFRPDCIVSVDMVVVEQNAAFYNDTGLPLFITAHGRNLVKPRKNVTFVHPAGIHKFARDVTFSVFEGHTVTFVALQLAFHMGFGEVALVGADHNFAVKGPANSMTIATGRDESHFDPNYFSGGVVQTLPNLAGSEAAYAMARDAYAAHGRRIVNATEGGKLEIFERMPLDRFLDRASGTAAGQE